MGPARCFGLAFRTVLDDCRGGPLLFCGTHVYPLRPVPTAPAAALLALDLPSHVREALHKALEDEERLSRAREAERVGASTEEAGPDGEDGAGDGGGGDGVESGMAEEPPNGE